MDEDIIIYTCPKCTCDLFRLFTDRDLPESNKIFYCINCSEYFDKKPNIKRKPLYNIPEDRNA